MAKAGMPSYKIFDKDPDTLTAATRLVSLSKGHINALVEEISWVHYMVYHNGSATTLPLTI